MPNFVGITLLAISVHSMKFSMEKGEVTDDFSLLKGERSPKREVFQLT